MQRNFLTLLLLLMMFVGLSYVLSVSAIPATRTQNLKGLSTKVEHVLDVKNVVLVEMEEGIQKRRMDLENQDYDGTGANTDHEPKVPKPPKRFNPYKDNYNLH